MMSSVGRFSRADACGLESVVGVGGEELVILESVLGTQQDLLAFEIYRNENETGSIGLDYEWSLGLLTILQRSLFILLCMRPHE